VKGVDHGAYALAQLFGYGVVRHEITDRFSAQQLLDGQGHFSSSF
jgi:hypothetical protein